MTVSHGYRRCFDCKYRTDAAMKMEFDSQMLRLVWHQESGSGTIATYK
jgi:hypothetical protein